MKFRDHLFLFCLLSAFPAAVPHPAFAASRHDVGAECRRELRVEGQDGTPVTATTTVFLGDNATGIVLTDAQGAIRPFNLLNRAGSQCTILFNATAGETLYLYPSATASLPPPPEFGHRSGLCHLVCSYDGREVTSAAQFADLWKRATFQGGRFEEQVYAAFNPFGPNTNTLHRYDGFLAVAKGGLTHFCVASTDASFLLIDGREVAAWPGKHPVTDGLNGSKRGSVQLESGTHRFTFLHANGGNDSFALAAMILPGEQRHFVIGPEYFTRAVYAFVGPLTSKDGQRHQADFLWENRYMVAMRNHAMNEFAFEAIPFKDDPSATFEWDFGDGTRGSGMKTNHLYFAQGEVPVTLTVTFGDGLKAACRQNVLVAPRYGQNENDDGRALELLDRAARQERESRIQPEGYALIAYGYLFFLKNAEAAAFAERALAAADRIPEADLGPLMFQLALDVQQVNEQYELSERCFRVILAKAKDPVLRASAALHFGGMLNLCLNRPQEAREVLAAIRRQDLIDWEQRLLDIYVADTAMVLDDVATAQKLYAAIPTQNALVTDNGMDRKALFDYNSRYFRVQNLLSQGLYRESMPEVDMLEWEIPEERASPRMNLMKVQALVGNNQPRKAAVCLQRALLAERDETYTPKLRLELAKLYVGMNQFVQAKHQIARIRNESPWTQEEIDARKLLDEIKRKIGEATP